CIVVHKRKFHGPVMGKFEQPPFGVVKRGLGKLKVTGLGEVALTKTEPQVFGGIGTMTVGELPAEVEEQLLARRSGSIVVRGDWLRLFARRHNGFGPSGPGNQGC